MFVVSIVETRIFCEKIGTMSFRFASIRLYWNKTELSKLDCLIEMNLENFDLKLIR